MGSARQPDTEELLNRAGDGDQTAVNQLVVRHRPRLRRMVKIYLDRRLSARVDPSDIVQDALGDAVRKLPGYLRNRPLPFYPWLRELARERIVREHRRHLRAANRSVVREVPDAFGLPDHSAAALGRLLTAGLGSPSEQLAREEQRAEVRRLLEELPHRDQEVLALRYLEQLDAAEIAAVTGMTEDAVRARVRRALERFTTAWKRRFNGDGV